MLRHVRRQLRVVGILDAAERAGLTPLPIPQFHAVAYFADALAPVWGLRILDAQLLKRQGGPVSPVFQRDVDLLVGRGVVVPRGVNHVQDLEGGWRLNASYILNEEFARPILKAATSFEQQSDNLAFLRELVHAMSALGVAGIGGASASDAAYGDQMVDSGGLIDIEGVPGHSNLTAQVALRFGALLQSEVRLTSAEMIHFYVRELFKKMSHVA